MEELTARAAGPPGRRGRGPPRARVLFDGVRAEIHPYDVTVERDGAAEAYDCKWGARGINADVLHQLDDARSNAADEDERLDGGAGGLRRPAFVRCPSRAPDGAARVDRDRDHRDARRAGRAGALTLQAADTCSAPYRVRFDECGPDGLVRTSVLLRYSQDLAGYHSAVRGFGRDWYAEHGITWLVRAAEVAVVGPIPLNAELVGTTQVVGWRRVWARRRTEFQDAVGTLVAWVHIDWVLIDGRGAPTRIPAEFDSVFGAPPASFGLARVTLEDAPSEASRTRLTVRPQELDPMDHVNNAVYADWLDEAVQGAGGTVAVRAVPRLARLEYARAAAPGASVDAEGGRTAKPGRAGSATTTAICSAPDSSRLTGGAARLVP